MFLQVHLTLLKNSLTHSGLGALSAYQSLDDLIIRSRVFGFPDYTTVQQDGDTLRIYGRLRFGRRDFDVNRTRVDGWLAALQS